MAKEQLAKAPEKMMEPGKFNAWKGGDLNEIKLEKGEFKKVKVYVNLLWKIIRFRIKIICK